MTEASEARVALGSADVTERTAAARVLATSGTVDDLPLLLSSAVTDKSPSVRIYAAGAASELATRSALSPAAQSQVLQTLKTWDPGANPSLVLVFAALTAPEGLDRLGRMLRDPRSDVRTAAATALRRMANLPAAPADLPQIVGRWLEAGKHPSDAVAEMIRLAGECGWVSLEPVLRRAAGAGRSATEAAALALQWLEARRDPTSWAGTWMTTDDGPNEWLYLIDRVAWGRDGRLGELQVEEGIGTVPRRAPLRRVWATRTAAEGTAEAITLNGRTLWRHQGNGLTRVVEELGAVLREVPEVARGLAAEMKDLEGVSAVRARAFALWMGGQLAEADRVLTASLAGERKPHPQSLWIRANVSVGLGDLDAARAAVKACLETAPKKASYRADAEALSASLGTG